MKSLLIAASLGLALLLTIAAASQANAQMFALSETNLPPGTYVVTAEGYWTIQAWISAHAGKAIPASIIVIPQTIEPQLVVKEKTKVIHDHDHEDGHNWWWKNKKWNKDNDGNNQRGSFEPWIRPGHGGGGSSGGGSSGGGSSGGGSSND